MYDRQDGMIAGATPAAAIEGVATEEFLDRELQWLEFNDRVLAQAIDERTPLLERVRFLAIFSSNLDEFFMKRVGGLRRQVDAGISATHYSGASPQVLLEQIREKVIPLTKRKAKCYRKAIVPALKELGIELLEYGDLGKSERTEVRKWYRRNVFPVLTPLAVDPGHRFPFISNLSLSLGAMLRRPNEDEPVFARVKVPEVIPQWYRIGGGLRCVQLQDIIEHNLDDLFPGMEILEVLPFRLTRNADLEGDTEDAEDLLAQIRSCVSRSPRTRARGSWRSSARRWRSTSGRSTRPPACSTTGR
jgi:polyphosphate kinase